MAKKAMPFRYEEEQERHFEIVRKFYCYNGSKNRALKLALKFTAGFIEKEVLDKITKADKAGPYGLSSRIEKAFKTYILINHRD